MNAPFLIRSVYSGGSAPARAVLEQVEARGEFGPVTLWNTREPWLIDWGLVELERAPTIFEADLAALARERKEIKFRSTGMSQMVELVIASP